MITHENAKTGNVRSADRNKWINLFHHVKLECGVTGIIGVRLKLLAVGMGLWANQLTGNGAEPPEPPEPLKGRKRFVVVVSSDRDRARSSSATGA
jgi:hypothetical protein